MPARKRQPPITRPPPKAAPVPPEPEQVSKCYRVLSGGVSTPGGARWHGEIVDAGDIGDVDRIQSLLMRGSIEEVTDAA